VLSQTPKAPPLPHTKKEKEMSPVLPPKEQKANDTVSSGVVFPKDLHTRIGEIAKERGYSRNEVIVHFLRWALAEHEREEKAQAERDARDKARTKK
jgi:hypothetical protein